MDAEQRFMELQDILDAVLVREMTKESLDLLLRSEEIDEAHRLVIDLMFREANGEGVKDELKSAFKQWLALLKVTPTELLLKAPVLVSYTSPRKCYSLGCVGLVQFIQGQGVCSACGLRQVLVNVEVPCTSAIYSTDPEPSKVSYLETRKKLRATGRVRPERGASLF